MNLALAESVRGKCGVIAVSNAYTLAPWADALVAHDMKWWRAYPAALGFAGRKFCHGTVSADVTRFRPPGLNPCLNSGVYAMHVAETVFAATRLLLLGFDMHGDHFFGRHPEPLTNTTDRKRLTHLRQFREWSGCEVVNCTPGSAITNFPFAGIEEAL